MQTIEKVKELAKGYDIVPVFRYGYDRFSKKCAEVGIDGFIIPDMPYEQSIEIAGGDAQETEKRTNRFTNHKDLRKKTRNKNNLRKNRFRFVLESFSCRYKWIRTNTRK